jgi:outer membrane protein assembly factor BamB
MHSNKRSLIAGLFAAFTLVSSQAGFGQIPIDTNNFIEVTTMPTNGIFWSWTDHFPPSPFNPAPSQLPVYSDGVSSNYVYDDREFDWTNYSGNWSGTNNWRDKSNLRKEDVPSPPGEDGGGGYSGSLTSAQIGLKLPGSGYTNCETWTNFFLLISTSSGGVYVTISNTLPGLSYVLLESTTLMPANWEPVGTNTATGYTLTFGPFSSSANPMEFFQAILATNDEPPVITQGPSNQVVYTNSTAVFTVSATGLGPLFYQWQLNGTNLTNGGNIAGATTSALTITAVTNSNVGSYTVIVSNIICSASAEAGLGLIWSTNLGSGINASPAIGPDGTIYIANTASTFFALDPFAGGIKWSNTSIVSGISGDITSSAAVAPDGSAVYVGSQDGYLYAFSPTNNGALLWRTNLGCFISSTPAINPTDGTVYVTGENGSNGLFAINPSGGIKWNFQTDDSPNGIKNAADSSPVVSGDCTIYFLSDNGDLYAVDSSGSLLWFFPIPSGSTPDASPALDSSGNILIGSADGYVYCINPGGGLVWVFDTGDRQRIESSVAIGADSTVYAASTDGNLYAITNGVLLWKFSDPTGLPFVSSPAVTADNVVVIGSEDNSVYGITNRQIAWSYATGGGVVSSPSINPWNGAVIIGSYDNILYQIPGTEGPAASSWPMFHQNVSHTGTVPNANCAMSATPAVFPNNPGFAGSSTTFLFNLSGTAGTAWVIYASSDLVNWGPMSLATLSSDSGTFQVSDSSVAGVTNRFYQARAGNFCSQVIGFVNIRVKPGINLIANQLYQVNDSDYPQNTAQGLLGFLNNSGLSLPDQSQIFKWNGMTFLSNEYSGPFQSWLPNGDITLLPGEAEFFDISTNSPTITIPVAGLVPQGVMTNLILPGYNYVSSIIPATGRMQTDLGYVPNERDIVGFVQNNATQFHEFLSNAWFGGEPTLSPGQGFTLTTSFTNAWVQSFFACAPTGYTPLPQQLTNSSGGTGAIHSSPCVGPDGSIYISVFPDEFYGINPSGGIKWAVPLASGDISQGFTSSPSITSNGSFLFIGSTDGHLYSFNPANGGIIWSNNLGGEVTGTPSIAGDGSIVVGTFNGATNGVYDLNPTNGTTNWVYFGAMDLEIPGSAVVGPDCTVYFTSLGGNSGVYALYPSGIIKWFVPMTTSSASASMALDAAGNLYVGNGNSGLLSISQNGTTRWAFQLPDLSTVAQSPVIGPDLTVYAVDRAGGIWAITNGGVKWAVTNLGDRFFGSPALDSNNVLYAASAGNSIYAVSNGVVRWQFTVDSAIESAPVLSPSGELIVASTGGILYNVPANAPATNAPWPLFQKTASHSGADHSSVCYNESCVAPVPFDAALFGSSFSFNVIGAPQSIWNLLASYSLSGPWFPEGTVTLDSTGSAFISDSQFPSGTVDRFYQLTDSNCCSQIVGFATLTIEPGTNLITDPFIESDGNNGPMNSLPNLLNSALTPQHLSGTTVLTWNGNRLVDYTFEDTNGAQWFLNGAPNGTGLLTPGQSAWLINPSSTVFNVVFAGLVLQADGDQVTNTVLPGLPNQNYVAPLVPEAGTVTSLLGYPPNNGDQIQLFNPTNQTTLTFTYSTSLGWSRMALN